MTPYDYEWAMMNKPKKSLRHLKSTQKIVAKNNKCDRCGSLENLTADHIIPSSLLKSFNVGTTNMVNLQTLCRKCNLAKANKLDPKNPKTVPLLEMYIEQWKDFYQVPRKKNVYVFKNLKVNHDTTVYKFGIPDPIEDLKDIYRKQSMRATWRI